MCGRNKNNKATVGKGVGRFSRKSHLLKAIGEVTVLGVEKKKHRCAVHKGSSNATEMSDGRDLELKRELGTHASK